MKLKLGILAALIILLLTGCTSGGDDNDNNDNGDNGNTLSQNACGALGLSSRIITGTECSENNSPVVKVTLVLPDGRTGTCSGTMISNQWALTAAHCFFENPVQAFVSAAGVSVEAASVIVHPDVSIDQKQQSVFNDVALIRLVRTVTLPTLPLVASRSPVSGDIIDIFGYGQTEDQSDSNNTVGTLRSGQMSISSVSTNFIQAVYDGEGSNTCSGDSGGPALLDVNGQLAIAGVLSSGTLLNCERGDISQFTNVQAQSVFDFITKNVPDAQLR